MKILQGNINSLPHIANTVPYKIAFLQLMRYGIVGLLSNALGYGCYLFMTDLGLTPKIAMSLLYISVASFGFFGNRKFTFSHQGATGKTSLRYISAHVMGYMLNIVILFIGTDCLGYPHEIVQAIAIFVVAFFLFITFKFFVFKTSTQDMEHLT
jgi:putative flippase GtrA